MKVIIRFNALLLAAACAVVGCKTVDKARHAQRAIAAYTNDTATVSVTNRVDLRKYKLVDYVAFASTNRPNLEASRLAVSNAVLALLSVTSDRALQADLSGGYSQSTLNSGPNREHFSWRQERGNFTGGVNFDLLLYDFGRLDAREQSAREELLAAKRDLANAELAVFNEVCQSYFTLLRNDALLEVARTNEFMHAEHLKQSEQLFGVGEAKKLDVLKARVDLSDAKLATINASNDVVTASAEFLRSLGLDHGRARRAEVLKVASDCLAESTNALPVTTYSAVEALAIARTNSPSLAALRARLRASVAQVDYAVADLKPRISLSSAFNFVDPAWNWSWGFQAVQSLMDGYRKELAIKSAVVAMESCRAAVESAEQQLSCELAVAAANRDNARQSLATARVEVEQARENFENVMMQYRVGDASRLDFTDAVGALANALGARVKAFYSAETAEAELVRLTGRDPWRLAVPEKTSVKKNNRMSIKDLLK